MPGAPNLPAFYAAALGHLGALPIFSRDPQNSDLRKRAISQMQLVYSRCPLLQLRSSLALLLKCFSPGVRKEASPRKHGQHTALPSTARSMQLPPLWPLSRHCLPAPVLLQLLSSSLWGGLLHFHPTRRLHSTPEGIFSTLLPAQCPQTLAPLRVPCGLALTQSV